MSPMDFQGTLNGCQWIFKENLFNFSTISVWNGQGLQDTTVPIKQKLEIPPNCKLMKTWRPVNFEKIPMVFINMTQKLSL